MIQKPSTQSNVIVVTSQVHKTSEHTVAQSVYFIFFIFCHCQNRYVWKIHALENYSAKVSAIYRVEAQIKENREIIRKSAIRFEKPTDKTFRLCSMHARSIHFIRMYCCSILNEFSSIQIVMKPFTVFRLDAECARCQKLKFMNNSE